ncbi:MAG: PadR family transcriptional regulator [Anaerolineales bacterium]
MNTKDYLPLTETSFLIVLSLVTEPKHGYAILKEVELLSDRRVKMATGTLYSALRRMLEEGWIEQVEDVDSGQTDRIRKFYRLTKLGRRIFEAESTRLRKLSEIANLREVEQPQ